MIFPIYEGTDVLPWLHSLDTASNPTLSLPGPRPLLETSLLRLTFSLKNSGMPSLSGPDTKLLGLSDFLNSGTKSEEWRWTTTCVDVNPESTLRLTTSARKFTGSLIFTILSEPTRTCPTKRRRPDYWQKSTTVDWLCL